MTEPRLPVSRRQIYLRRSATWLSVAALAAALGGCNRHDPFPAGQEQLKQGNYKAALIELMNAVDQAPDSIPARLALVDAMERTNDLAGAENQLRKALERGADADVVVPRIAALMLDRNDLDKLIRDFKTYKLKSPASDSSLRAAVAIAHLSQRRLPLAQEQLAAATTTTPMTQLAQAQVLLVQGDREKALQTLGGTQPGPDTPWWVLRAIGRLAALVGDGNTAVATFKRAHDAAPWHVGLTGEYGDALLNSGRVDEASAVRDQLKKAAPNHFWTHLLDAELMARAGRVEESLAAAVKVLAVSPEHLPAALLAARAELSKGDRLMAAKRLSTAEKLHPSSLAVLELQAQVQLANNETAQALDTVRRARAQAPKEPRFLALEAEATRRRGDAKRATVLYTELAALQPDKAEPLMSLAELKAGQGDRAGASALLDKAGELGRNQPETMDRLVATAIRLRDLPRARHLADQAVAAQPDKPTSHLTLAAVQAAQQDYAGAWRSTLTALDRDPVYVPALQALARMARKPDEKTELLARYAKAVDTKDVQDATVLEYAAMLRDAKQPTAARIALLDKTLRARPESVPLRSALVEAHLREGESEKALGIAQAGASIVNAGAEAQELLATVYERVGKTDQSIRAYRSMAAAFPQRYDLKLRLASLEAQAGRKAEAATLLKAAITARPFESQAYVLLAHLMAVDNPTEALSVARQMTGREELKLDGMVLEGVVLAASKKYDEALNQLTKAGQAGAMPAARLRWIDVVDKMGRQKIGDEAMTSLLGRYPKHIDVLTAAARRATAADGRAGDKTVELLKRAVEQAPDSPILLNDLAWAQVMNNQAAEALPHARKAVALLPDNGNVLDTLGVALSRNGKHDEAVPALREASQMMPSNFSPRLHLVEALIAAGNRRGAADAADALPADKLSAADKAQLDKLRAKLAG